MHISRREGLHRLEDPWGKPAGVGESPRGTIEELFGPVRFTRLYFGQEFCERAMPGKQDMLEAVGECTRKKIAFTLVTPYATEKGLAGLEELLGQLAGVQPGCEVVVNDWGVLYLLRRKFPAFRPVAGRLLNKILRDPRMNCHLSRQGPAGQMKMFQGCSFSGRHMKNLLGILNVDMVELDNYFQGLDEDLPNWGPRLSLHVPFGCIATGRICLFGSWGQKKNHKFRSCWFQCSRLCRRYRLELSSREYPSENYSVFVKGNTAFYEQTGAFLAGGLAAARELGFSRIVYHPEPL